MSTGLQRNTYRILDKTVAEKTIWVPDSWFYPAASWQTRAMTRESQQSTNSLWIWRVHINHCSHLAPWVTLWYGRAFLPLASTCVLLVLDGALSRGFKSFLRGKGAFSSSPNIRIFQSTRGVHKHVRNVAAKVDLTVRSNGLILLEFQILRGQFVLCGANKIKGVRKVWCDSHLFSLTPFLQLLCWGTWSNLEGLPVILFHCGVCYPPNS